MSLIEDQQGRALYLILAGLAAMQMAVETTKPCSSKQMRRRRITSKTSMTLRVALWTSIHQWRTAPSKVIFFQGRCRRKLACAVSSITASDRASTNTAVTQSGRLTTTTLAFRPIRYHVQTIISCFSGPTGFRKSYHE
jgi:hypothetical protein